MIKTKEVVKANGLIYITDAKPGIYRKGKIGSFFYQDKNGNKITDKNHLQRIKSLVLPPAWKNVWIAEKPNAYLQATGIDASDRKQYRYHSKWNSKQSDHKYLRLLEFGSLMPEIRKKITKDLKRKQWDEQKVLAICVDLLQKTLLRVGGKTYMKQYGTFGLSTLRNKHVKIQGNSLRLSFVGKKGVLHDVDLKDGHLVKLIKKCKDIPGQELFQFYTQEGGRKSISSDKINDYIKTLTGSDFTAKDFRTWGGTLEALRQFSTCKNQFKELSKKKAENFVLDCVAKKLGNTRAVCKSAYVYPLLLEAYESDKLQNWIKKIKPNNKLGQTALRNDEKVLISFLKAAQKKS